MLPLEWSSQTMKKTEELEIEGTTKIIQTRAQLKSTRIEKS